MHGPYPFFMQSTNTSSSIDCMLSIVLGTGDLVMNDKGNLHTQVQQRRQIISTGVMKNKAGFAGGGR